MNNSRKEILQSLGEKMSLVMRRVYVGQGFRFSQFKLSPPQVQTLFFLSKQQNGVAVKDLAEMLRVTPGAVTQSVDAMVDMDLVRREEDPRDRRIVRVKLTRLAAGKLDEFRRGYLESVGRVFDVLSDTEIRLLARILHKVTSAAPGEAEDALECK